MCLRRNCSIVRVVVLSACAILISLWQPSLAVAQVALLEPPIPEAPQPRPPEPDRAPGEVRLGRLRLTPSIGLTDIGIDTNVFDDSGRRTKDMTATVHSETQADLDFGAVRLVGTGNAGYTYYRDIERERSFDRGVSSNLELRPWQRLTLYGTNSFENTRKPFNFEVQGRASRKMYLTEVGVKFGLSRKLALEMAGNETRRRFADNATFLGIRLNDTVSERSRRVSGTIAYAVTPLTTIEVTGVGAKIRFPVASPRNNDLSQFTAGVLFKPRALISGVARVGYQRSLVLHDAALAFEGVVAKLGLNYRLRDGLTVGVVGNRMRSASIEPEYPYYVLDHVGLSVRRHLFRHFNAYLEANRTRMTYAAFGTADRPALRAVASELTYWYAAVLDAGLVPGGRMELFAEYRPLPSRVTGARQAYGYEGLKLGMTISVGRFAVGSRQPRDSGVIQPGI